MIFPQKERQTGLWTVAVKQFMFQSIRSIVTGSQVVAEEQYKTTLTIVIFQQNEPSPVIRDYNCFTNTSRQHSFKQQQQQQRHPGHLQPTEHIPGESLPVTWTSTLSTC